MRSGCRNLAVRVFLAAFTAAFVCGILLVVSLGAVGVAVLRTAVIHFGTLHAFFSHYNHLGIILSRFLKIIRENIKKILTNQCKKTIRNIDTKEDSRELVL